MIDLLIDRLIDSGLETSARPLANASENLSRREIVYRLYKRLPGLGKSRGASAKKIWFPSLAVDRLIGFNAFVLRCRVGSTEEYPHR